jgi:hypothetical protein
MKSAAALTSQKGWHPKKKGPAVSTRPFLQGQLIQSSINLHGIAELPIPVLLTLLAGFLALTVRILLLLSRLLAAALLLARLLPRVLVLLAGILVLIGHRDLPFQSRSKTIAKPAFGCGETWVPWLQVGPNCGSAARFAAGGKTISVQALAAPSGAVAGMGSRC